MNFACFVVVTNFLFVGVSTENYKSSANPNSSKCLYNMLKQYNLCKESCTDDCQNIVRCINSEPHEINCKKQSGDRPYCNSETLQCDNSPNFCTIASEKCSKIFSKRYIPDLLACDKYYYCENGFKVPYKCDVGTRFDPKIGHCSYSSYCYIFNEKGHCRGRMGQIIAHPLDKNLYILCDNTPILSVCDGVNYEFNPKTSACEYICKRSGHFKDFNVKNGYYSCIPKGNSFVKFRKKCNSPYMFIVDNSENEGHCGRNSSRT